MKKRILALTMLVAMLGLTACASNDTSVGRFKVGKPYTINGRTYYPEENYTHTETGLASWYGPGFHGKKTANGERFDENEFTAAHKTLQLPSLVRVTNLDNGRSVVVRVTDRGPFHGNRIIDVSKGAAEALDFRRAGTARVMIQVLGPESQALAEAARRKIDTRGAEIAVNETGMLDERFAAFYPSEFAKAEPQNIRLASNDHYQMSDAGIETVRPPYEPASPVEQAIAWNPSPQPTIPPIDTIAPAAGPEYAADGTPYPPSMPPQRRDDTMREPVITRTRSDNFRHPDIPLATLDTASVAPKPVYRPASIRPTAVYVQAGAFTSQSNAQKAAQAVAPYGPHKIIEARLGGQPYYRLRIGPFESVEKADALVNTLQRQGRQASIVISEN
ncbi:MAG: septal ring lytic transglycosylase RlpA family protein [Proteobacteria bacterium]|nr:septal ring lytic transglycosylase RlpA family protein [Pseudomonadota bacterium]